MLIIDGHNFIGTVPGYSLDDEENSREALLRRLAAAKGHSAETVVVVFDSDRCGGPKDVRYSGLTVVFARGNRTADHEILRRLGAGNPRGATVVTSDRELARAACSLGAGVKSCKAFASSRIMSPRKKAPSLSNEKPEATSEDVERWLLEFSSKEK